ncbi:MAG: hypothetical protein H3Z54_13060 [archaeon]|nr:hypothetical protein [archaeon]
MKRLIGFLRGLVVALVIDAGLLAIITGTVYLTLNLAISYVGFFPASIPSSNAIEIFKAVITVSGVLIGFSGFVLASSLSSISTTASNISVQLFEKVNLEPSGRLTHTPLSAELEQTLRKFLWRRNFMMIAISVVFILFTLAIFAAFKSMAIVPVEPGYGATRLPFIEPFTYLMAGVITLLIAIVIGTFYPIPRIEEKTPLSPFA